MLDPSLSKLDELSLKKKAVKETEGWKRDAKKVGGTGHVKFAFTDAGVELKRQKTRGIISDIPGEVIARKKKASERS
jgi:hypothetical protein